MTIVTILEVSVHIEQELVCDVELGYSEKNGVRRASGNHRVN